MAEQLEILADAAAGQDALIGKAVKTREGLVRLAALVEQASHERWVLLGEAPDGQRLLRTLRRVRHDIDMLRRAGREAGDDALHAGVAEAWRRAALSAAASLRAAGRIFAGEAAPGESEKLSPAIRDYRVALTDMRQSGVTHSLSTGELSRLFGVSFALEQLRRDLDDLIEVAGETSGQGAAAASTP